ncbi:MAG: hypothetical protein KIA12_06470, partial [Varibaculum cambriense]|uniref:hypothetical protein n=1 Tax=Varibaculum cambriense TaxID=184870 RepID=UPI00241CF058
SHNMLSKHIQTIITPDQTPKNNEFIHTIQVLTRVFGVSRMQGGLAHADNFGTSRQAEGSRDL